MTDQRQSPEPPRAAPGYLPLLDLTAQEAEALILAARAYTHLSKGPTLAVLRSALDKLVTEETA